MPVIQDEEFGKITIRRSARATQVRVRVGPDGTLRASLPLYAPIFLVKRLLKSSRTELRSMFTQARPDEPYNDGMRIGKSHSLIVRPSSMNLIKVSRHHQQIIVQLPEGKTLENTEVIRAIRDAIISALRLEAKSYLPKRLSFLSDKHSFSYDSVRFSHASGRWGSCSSTGTISLNIALMKLPFELIDYVIIHELSHTRHMNHSQAFWDVVGSIDPHYQVHRRALKLEKPSI
ncbi:M48 family metallopeptidase [Candidatus Saccharibacteria bacterium]|nr:M48 family metallopeptidase [Candidatus Saccharibacteria bacterium]